MKRDLNKFDIEIDRLNNGHESFEYKIDDQFFNLLDQSLIEKGNLQTIVSMDRTSTMVKCSIHIDGVVELTCDRTLNLFNHPIHSVNNVTYKFSDKDEELTDEIILIKHDTRIINVAQILFDFIALNIPLKKIHPDFLTEADFKSDDNILIYSSISNESEPTDTDIDILDPRWEALKKLKDTF